MIFPVLFLLETFKIETLRVYPRVHYFQRRFSDLLPRLKRVIGAFPKSFHIEKAIQEIDDLNDKFTKKLNIVAIGHSELEFANIVVSTKPFEIEKISDLKEPPSIHLFLCYTKTDSLDQTGLKNDMSKVISDAEKTMASAGHIITIMGKMMFEIEGYLEQTITEKYEPKTQTADVPKDLRNAILELKDVYSTGTVYDVFEIHVREQTTALKEDLSTLMHKHGYTQPYQVKIVKKEPVKMMAEREDYQKPVSR
ncbi:uncharacterized protein LOC123551965 isoform X2 [Mercenaria mercenaria]|uniref:uncharacterized protein LOC123551965 isoform X2 n=1 Tax=Mercenaria mercenaria TaxID=6596 RepID=UPI00234F3FDB|nr:uncharacterized protein LOC123551965 isoform X2 [Mercenaria mercenaria]